MSSFRPLFIAFQIVFIISFTGALSGQGDDLRLRVANLSQDVGLLSQEVRALRLEIESLRTENQNLRTQLGSINTLRSSLNVLSAKLDQDIAQLRAAMTAGDQEVRRTVLLTVSEQIELLGKQTEQTLRALGDNPRPAPSPARPTIVLDDDYPKSGVPYQVKSGDTLSSIATQNNSRILWIQKANKITDPTKLQAGQNIFVPQAE